MGPKPTAVDQAGRPPRKHAYMIPFIKPTVQEQEANTATRWRASIAWVAGLFRGGTRSTSPFSFLQF